MVTVSYESGTTRLALIAASVYEVAPNFQFDVPLNVPQAAAADISADCKLRPDLGVSPYAHISDVSFSGGWSTADVFGVHIKDGVRATVAFNVEAGVHVTAGVGASCSVSLEVDATGMAGPIPVTAGIAGDLSAYAAAGGQLDSGGSIAVMAGGHTIGLPPALVLIPDVSFGEPHFNLTAQKFEQATAGIGLTVKAGVGVGGAASLTLNVGTSLDFNAQPGQCTWNANFGQFSVEGQVLDWSLSSPQTPALFTHQLGGNFCADTAPPTPPPPPPPPSPPPSPQITFDGDVGTEAPPPTLGGYTMETVNPTPTELGELVSGIEGPTGTIAFSEPLRYERVAEGWETWSNGYTGAVYTVSHLNGEGLAETVITLPFNTGAFYLYAEPDEFENFSVTATAQDGTTSGPTTVYGEAGAQYFGFYASCGNAVSTIRITDGESDPELGIGEFGIAPTMPKC